MTDTVNKTGEADRPALLSVVVPIYNEEKVIEKFHDRLINVLNGLDWHSEILYVDDGSNDATVDLLRGFCTNDPRIGLLQLSRNFGKDIALTAGLDHAQGDAVVVIDADLQDPPEVIPRLIEKFEEGFDVVYATRIKRNGEGVFRRMTASLFYRVMRFVSKSQVPVNTGDFRIISRRAVRSLKDLREQHRFMKGLFSWVGFPQASLPYERDARYSGKSKWDYLKLWNFAIEGLTSFTTTPLKLATYLGIFIALLALIYAIYIFVDTLIHGNPVAGYPSQMVVILFLGGVQLIFIGLIGEYLGRTFDEVKQRPLYILKEMHPPASPRVRKNSGDN